MKKALDVYNEYLYRMRVYPINTDSNTVEWVADFPDLPGCVGAGDTAEEAVSMAIDAKKAWIEVAIEDGKNIPEPKNLYEGEYSGKFTLRLPKTLHKELTLYAEDEGVSLNQYILYLIVKGMNREISATKDNIRQKTYKLEIEESIISSDNIIETWKRNSFLEEPSKVLKNLLKSRRF